jgi:hypothetical protein
MLFKQRSLLSLCFSTLLALGGITATSAQMDEVPVRKAGLWEAVEMIKLTDGTEAEAISLMCTSPTFERKWREIIMAYGNGTLVKLPDGYVLDVTLQDTGSSAALRTEVSGDFDSAITKKITKGIEMLTPAGIFRMKPINQTVQEKWLAPSCPEGWKPGDVESPFGIRSNELDILKGALKGVPKNPSVDLD